MADRTRSIAAVVAILVGCLAARAALAAEYLIVPLIGDRLTIASANPRTGSHMDRNDYHVTPLPQLPFYDAIEAAIVGAVKKVDKQPAFKALAFRNGLPGTDLEHEGAKEVAQKVVKALASQIRPGEKQWIVLLLPVRLEPRMRLHTGRIGHGRVGGLGFYIDRSTRLQRMDSLEADVGFLGMFANFTILMIDPADGAIVAQRSVQAGEVRSIAGSGKNHPWDVMSAENKVRAINGLANREVREAMPEVLSDAGLK